jgi:hypothetical protein
MKFVELSGRTLSQVINEDEMPVSQLEKVGLTDESVVRINEQGDIEIRRPDGWDIIGGLLGDFRSRIRNQTGMEWV